MIEVDLHSTEPRSSGSGLGVHRARPAEGGPAVRVWSVGHSRVVRALELAGAPSPSLPPPAQQTAATATTATATPPRPRPRLQATTAISWLQLVPVASGSRRPPRLMLELPHSCELQLPTRPRTASGHLSPAGRVQRANGSIAFSKADADTGSPARAAIGPPGARYTHPRPQVSGSHFTHALPKWRFHCCPSRPSYASFLPAIPPSLPSFSHRRSGAPDCSSFAQPPAHVGYLLLRPLRARCNCCPQPHLA